MARAGKRGTGPRGEHNRDEFLALVTKAAENLVRQEGLRGLGMRRLASTIGYAPNSIYNAVGDLDAVMMRVNARTLGTSARGPGIRGAAGRHPARPGPGPRRCLSRLRRRGPAGLEPRLRAPDRPRQRLPGLVLPRPLARRPTSSTACWRRMIPDPDERRQAVAALWACPARARLALDLAQARGADTGIAPRPRAPAGPTLPRRPGPGTARDRERLSVLGPVDPTGRCCGASASPGRGRDEDR